MKTSKAIIANLTFCVMSLFSNAQPSPSNNFIVISTTDTQIPGCHANFNYTAIGNIVYFTDSSWFDAGAQSTTWFWNFGDGSTSIIQNTMHCYIFIPSDTVYTVCLTATNCSLIQGAHCSDSVCFQITLENPTNVETHQQIIEKVSVFPNPVSNSTTITFSPSQSQKVSVKIFDVNGRLVATLADRIFEAGVNEIVWNAAEANAGVYFLQMQAEENLKTEKLIVSK